MHRSARGRPVRKIDFKIMDSEGIVITEDGKSTARSTRSGKSVASTRSRKSGNSKTKKSSVAKGAKQGKTPKRTPKATKKVNPEEEDQDSDSREGDFESENEVDGLSLGSAASKVRNLNNEIEKLQPSLMEKYNEYKCEQGLQQRLEDSDLPDNLQDDEVFQETLELHKEQLQASQNREKRASRCKEITNMREEIIKSREKAKSDEWAAQLLTRRRMIELQEAEIQKEEEDLTTQQKLADQAIRLAQLRSQKVQLPSCAANEQLTGSTLSRNSVKGRKRAGQDKQQATADWVSTHSDTGHVVIAGGGINASRLNELQKKAQKLIESKQRPRTKTTQERHMAVTPKKSGKTAATTASHTGISHLRNLGLLPDKAGKSVIEVTDLDDLDDDEDILLQDIMDEPGKNPLKINANFDFNKTVADECGCTNGNGNVKVKSGKYAKSNIRIVRQEVWPHNAVSRKYVKRCAFDSMEFEMFVAGESKTIYGMLHNRGDKEQTEQGLGRLRVLTLISHWMCKCKNWPMIKGLYESIIEEIEMGECTWADDFSGYETMIANAQSVHVPQNTSVAKKPVDVFWCKNYQNGTCDSISPHMTILRQEDGPVPVQHICAACWSISKKRREHPENDGSCPLKK